MVKDIYQAAEERRSYYNIDDQKVVSEEKIEEVVEHAVKYTPTSFNSQTGRAGSITPALYRVKSRRCKSRMGCTRGVAFCGSDALW